MRAHAGEFYPDTQLIAAVIKRHIMFQTTSRIMELKCFFSHGFTTRWVHFLYPDFLHILSPVQRQLWVLAMLANVNTDHITSKTMRIVSDTATFLIGPLA